MEILLGICGLLYILATVLLVAIGPTVINFLISYYSCKRIQNIPIKILSMVIVSLSIYFNIKIPFVIIDIIHSIVINKEIITKKINLNVDEEVFLDSNVEEVKFKKHYFNTYGIGGDAGVMSFYTTNPRFVFINIENNLLKNGINIKNTNSDKYRLVIRQDNNRNTNILTAEVYDGNELTAQFKRYFRVGFPFEYGEADFNDREAKSLNKRKAIIAILSSNLLWDFFFKIKENYVFDDKFGDFLTKSIGINKTEKIAFQAISPQNKTVINNTLEDKELSLFTEANIKKTFTRDNKNIYINSHNCEMLSGVMYSELKTRNNITDYGILNTIIKYSDSNVTKGLYIDFDHEELKSINCGDNIFILTFLQPPNKRTMRLYRYTNNFSLEKISDFQLDYKYIPFLYNTSIINNNTYRLTFFQAEHAEINRKKVTIIKSKDTFDIQL